MKNTLLLVCAGLGLLLSGCTAAQLAKLPQINAGSFDWVRHDPLGGGEVHAKNVKVVPGGVHADSVVFVEKYPQWGVTLTVTDYTQGSVQADGTVAPAPIIVTPPPVAPIVPPVAPPATTGTN